MCLLKKDLNQSMEIRCDNVVVQRLDRQERSDYLSVILKEFKNSQDRIECNNNNQRKAVVQLLKAIPTVWWNVSAWLQVRSGVR